MADKHPTTRLYVCVFAALMVLLAITVAVAFVNLGRVNIFIALLVASVKAALVVLFFMHVRYSSRLTWVFVASGVIWLAILLVLTASDVATRPAHEGTRLSEPQTSQSRER